MAIAAPRSVFGIHHEAALYGVAMDVAKLLSELRLREGVDVIVANLPEPHSLALERF